MNFTEKELDMINEALSRYNGDGTYTSEEVEELQERVNKHLGY